MDWLVSAEVLFLFDHAMNDRSQDEFHRKAHFAAVHNNAGRARHKGIVDHAQQIAEVDPPLLAQICRSVTQILLGLRYI